MLLKQVIHIRFFPWLCVCLFPQRLLAAEKSLLLVFMTCNNYISLWHNYCHFCQQNAQGKGMAAAAARLVNTKCISATYTFTMEKNPKVLKQTVYCLTDEVTQTTTFSVQELCDRNSFTDKDDQWNGMKRHHFSTDLCKSHATHIFSKGIDYEHLFQQRSCIFFKN